MSSSDRDRRKRTFNLELRKFSLPALLAGNSAVREWMLARDPHDVWGDIMGLFFDVAGILYAEGGDIPDDWRYSPGMGQPSVEGMIEEGSWLAEGYRDGSFTLEEVRELGDVLHDASERARELQLDY